MRQEPPRASHANEYSGVREINNPSSRRPGQKGIKRTESGRKGLFCLFVRRCFGKHSRWELWGHTRLQVPNKAEINFQGLLPRCHNSASMQRVGSSLLTAPPLSPEPGWHPLQGSQSQGPAIAFHCPWAPSPFPSSFDFGKQGAEEAAVWMRSDTDQVE